jgi:peptidoglycan/LPS O-acetylase OafA/YrhL
VDLFFIISGFVIFMTLENSRHVYDFAAARFARIYPAYLASLLLTTCVLLLSPLVMLKPTAMQFAANLTMVPQIFRQEVVDGVYWTLSYEAAFYVFAALVIRRAGERLEEVCGLWLAGTLLLRFEPFFIWHYPYFLHMVRLATTGSFAPLFIAGIMLNRICAGRARPVTYALLASCLLVGLAGPLTFTRPMSGVGYCALISCFAFLVWLGGTDRLPLRLLAPFVFLGDISYSFYLLHECIGWVVMDRLLAWGLEVHLAFALTLAGAITLAFAVNRTIEKPAQRRLRAFFARHRMRLLREPRSLAVAAE